MQIVKDENQPQRMLRKKDLHISTLSKPQYRKQFLEADETSPFKNGEMDGKGKYLIYRHEDGKTKWRKVEYKKGKLISYKN